jgi:hypothetical protein
MTQIMKIGTQKGPILSVMDEYFPLNPPYIWTKITTGLFKIGPKAYIGLKDRVTQKEKFRAGPAGTVYFFIKEEKYTKYKGFIYRVKRVDGYNITQLDMDNLLAGQKLRITSRRSQAQLQKEYYDLFSKPE